MIQLNDKGKHGRKVSCIYQKDLTMKENVKAGFSKS